MSIFSRKLLGTDTKSTKISWFSYIWDLCIRQGWYNCYYSFINWKDLIFNDYESYALLKEDDPLEQCILYFWDSLEEDIYDKEFLEYLQQMVYDIETGKEKVIPLDEDFFERIKSLTDGVDI